ncbi:MAG: OsmC family protein [Bdellovibrionota bacterium]
MDIHVQLLGRKKVSAQFNGFTIQTDQPKEDGGDESAPGPFDLFLASLATCAGFFVQGFCQARGISTDGIEILQRSHRDETTHLVSKIDLQITLPKTFPEKYTASLLSAVNQCTVKKHLQNPPKTEVSAKIAESGEGRAAS